MSMIKDRPWRAQLDPDQRRFFDELPEAAARCRGTRRHHWHLNDLDMDGDNLPDGVEIIPLANGTCELRDFCIRDCGRYQSYLTDGEGGILWDTREYFTAAGRRYLAAGLALDRTWDRLNLQDRNQARLAGAIAKRLRIARRTALQSVAAAG